MKSKKGATLTSGFVWAIFLAAILFLLFFGGLGKSIEIIKFLNQIPAWLWVIFILIVLFKWMSK